MMGHGIRAVAALVIASTAAAAAATATPAGAAAAAPGLPGCDLTRRAPAHRAGGVAISKPRAAAPVPCATFVGTTSESASVGLTGAGDVLYAPLLENDAPPPNNTL